MIRAAAPAPRRPRDDRNKWILNSAVVVRSSTPGSVPPRPVSAISIALSVMLTSHHKTADERNQNRIRSKAREQEQDKEAVNAPTASYP